MKVDWVLPAPSGVPIGGYSIVYGHANGLVERGHDVTVHHLPGATGHDAPTRSCASRRAIGTRKRTRSRRLVSPGPAC